MSDIIEASRVQTCRRLYWKAAAGAGTGVAGVAAFSGVASAEAPPADPTGGGTTTLTEGITSWVQAYGVPMLVTLLVLGVVIGIFIRFGKKAKSTVG